MKHYSRYSLFALILLLFSMVSCDMVRTAEQDANEVVSPDGNPVATFTSNVVNNTIFEIDTVVYTIKTDKMIDRAITFDAKFVSGTATEDDYTVLPAVMEAYAKETKLKIVFHNDGVLTNQTKTAKFEIGVYGIAERYMLNPTQQFPTFDLTIKNANDPTLLIIELKWANSDDMDIVTWSDTPTNPLTEWGDGGATGANPETDKSILVSDPNGNYYLSFMDWDAPAFDYTLTLKYPNGTFEIITGTFNRAIKTYTNDAWKAWGGSYDSFRVLKIVKTGNTFVVTKL